ncbi:hypothetical protein CT694_35705 (plasmid) [Bacillus wiedmannii bv. thuringiensis]|nr:hypothetical protein CT694_35705 [Bacillus wiedmannii bv. thuringiensis]
MFFLCLTKWGQTTYSLLRKNNVFLYLGVVKNLKLMGMIHTPCLAKIGEDVIPVKGIPLIGRGCCYTFQTGYIHAVMFKQTFDSSLFAQKQKDPL